MPAPRKLPDNTELASLRNQGWSYDDIAAHYGVSKGAVYLRLRQINAVADRPTYKELLPWTVKKEHADAHPATMLRFMGRRLAGRPLSEVKERQLDKWLEEVRAADVVVCYDREFGPNPASPRTGGFYYKRRRPSDGDSLVRPVDSPGEGTSGSTSQAS